MANKIIYLKPLEKDSDGAWFWVHAWKDGGVTQDVEAVYFDQDGSDKVYSITVDENVEKMLMVRANPADKTPGSWSNKWNQSGDVLIPQDKNCWTWDNGWDGSTGSWSTYTPKTTEEYTVNLALGSYAPFELSQTTIATTTGSVAVELKNITIQADAGYQFKVIVKTDEDIEYKNWSFNSLTNILTISEVTQNLNLTIGFEGQIVLDGNYLKVNNNLWPEYKLQPHDDDEEQITLSFQANDYFKLVQVRGGQATEPPYHKECGTNKPDVVNYGDKGVEILETCDATIYAGVLGNYLGKIWVEVTYTDVTVTYTLDENITYSNSAETWPFKGDPYTTTLIAAEGYEIDYSTLIIKVGSNTFNAESSIFDKQTNTITITNVDGNISITASSKEKVVIIPGWYLWVEDSYGTQSRYKFSDESYDYNLEQNFELPAELTDYETTGGVFKFKVLYQNELGEEYWLQVENEDSDLGFFFGDGYAQKVGDYSNYQITMDGRYPRYHLYIQKTGDQLGHYWIEQSYPVTLTLSQAISSNIANKTYRWSDYETEIIFTGKPDTEELNVGIRANEAEVVWLEFDEVCTPIENGYAVRINEEDLGHIVIEASSEPEEGTTGWWLMDGEGKPIKEMLINPDNDQEYVVEHTLVANQYYSFDHDGVTVVLKDFNTASSTGPDGENEYYSGTGVGVDVDVYLEKITLNTTKTAFTINRNCSVKIYIRNSGRIWVAVEEEEIQITGENLDKLNISNTEHVYSKNNEYHTYPGVKVKMSVSGRSGYALKSLDVEHHGTTNKYTSVDGVASVEIEDVLSPIILTPEITLNESYKKIKLFDKAGTVVLYPKTNTEQVIDGVGNTLQTIIGDLLERIRTLESKINN